jgi:Zn-dependent protease with chaperone function
VTFKPCLISAVVLAVAVSSHAQPGRRDPRREQRIVQQLSDIAPSAVQDFQRATVALDRGDYATAVPLYRSVVDKAPDFTPALRRLGLSLMATGSSQDGLHLLERAVARERSPENLVSLAHALAFPGPGKQGSESERDRALGLAKEAAARYRGTDDPSYLALVAQLALSLRRFDDLRRAAASLEATYPNEMATHYAAAFQAALASDWMRANREIQTAERLGLPHEAAEAFLDMGVRSRVRAWQYVYVVLGALGLWAAGLGLLYVAGRALSGATLRSLATGDVNETTSASELSLRRIYRTLIRTAGIYYYISLPFVVVLVLGGTAAVVYGFLMFGYVPIKLVIVLVIAALVTVFKMVQSLFVRVDEEEPGRSLETIEAPGLWTLAHEVANTVGTRAIDEIRVTPGTDLAVYERGTGRERTEDTARRILILGVGLLRGFKQSAFRAVLAHEYGHFSHRDTAGGDVALRVRQDMIKFAIAIAQHGQAVWWNLAFQFLRLYDFLYRRISHGATRLQEVLADRVAARLYGPAQFEEGLRHVIRRAIEFDAAANDEIRLALQGQRSLRNLYTLPLPASRDVDDRFEEAIGRETTQDDTHPAPVDRFRLVSGVVSTCACDESGMVWDLFADQNALTAEMTSAIDERVKTVAAG